MVVVLAVVVAYIGPRELAGGPGLMQSAAGPDNIRSLGRRRWAAVEGGGIGCGSHPLAAVAGVAVAEVATSACPACPTLSTTLYGCAHPARIRAAGPTRSWSASGREEERRRRCWRKRHPAGIRRHIAVGVAAADVVASEAASGHAGSRPWRSSVTSVSTATRQLPPTGSPVIVLQMSVRLSSEGKI
jgi:hypothetical protein